MLKSRPFLIAFLKMDLFTQTFLNINVFNRSTWDRNPKKWNTLCHKNSLECTFSIAYRTNFKKVDQSFYSAENFLEYP